MPEDRSTRAAALLCLGGLIVALCLAGCGGPTLDRLREEADVAFKAERYNAAYAGYKAIVDRDPRNTHALTRLAECCLWLRDADRGLYWAKKALEVDPGSATAWEKKGELLLSSQKPEEALVAFKKALALDGQMNLTRLNMSVAYQALKQADSAVEIGREAVEMDPRKAEPHFRYAMALQAAKRYDEAEEEYRKAIALQPDHVDALMYLARLLVRERKKLADARQVAQKASEIRPGNGEPATLAAWALYLMGEQRPAVRELEQIARAHPTNFETWALLSKGFKDLGMEEAARQAAAFAMQTGPRVRRPASAAPPTEGPEGD